MEEKIIRLHYGNTNTYFVGGLLIDTDMAGTLPRFRHELKRQGITWDRIRCVWATHYHPDHMGLIGELMRDGVQLLLLTHQTEYVHFSDALFAREKRTDFVPIDERRATVITPEESRAFLAGIGISGRMIRTASHSPDGAALVLDDGNAFVGDLEPLSYLDGYVENEVLQNDWNNLVCLGARMIHYGHANSQTISQMVGW